MAVEPNCREEPMYPNHLRLTVAPVARTRQVRTDASGGCLMTRFIFITGGVASSLGKGLAAAALSALLQAQGFRVRMRKRSEEHTSELQSLMRISYAVFCLI